MSSLSCIAFSINILIYLSDSQINWLCDSDKFTPNGVGSWIFDYSGDCIVAQNICNADGAVTWLASNTAWKDYTIQTTIHFACGGDGHADIIFRTQSVGKTNYDGQYYALLIPFDNSVRLGKYFENGLQVLQSSNNSFDHSIDHTAKVQVSGNLITIYVDDMKNALFTVKDSTYSFGSIGLRTEQVYALFKNLYITGIPTQSPTPTPTANPSNSPTAAPSTPTTMPTTTPTANPSSLPTFYPTTIPTTTPSNYPTNPSKTPSKHPTEPRIGIIPSKSTTSTPTITQIESATNGIIEATKTNSKGNESKTLIGIVVAILLSICLLIGFVIYWKKKNIKVVVKDDMNDYVQLMETTKGNPLTADDIIPEKHQTAQYFDNDEVSDPNAFTVEDETEKKDDNKETLGANERLRGKGTMYSTYSEGPKHSLIVKEKIAKKQDVQALELREDEFIIKADDDCKQTVRDNAQNPQLFEPVVGMVQPTKNEQKPVENKNVTEFL